MMWWVKLMEPLITYDKRLKEIKKLYKKKKITLMIPELILLKYTIKSKTIKMKIKMMIKKL